MKRKDMIVNIGIFVIRGRRPSHSLMRTIDEIIIAIPI